ncbi:hypothetical protein BDF22DRAFT_667102 [Syncephalis plumigaleata]|nr:hypothetical protein BDF22DRAFT_667102 [Syncephalis plumigaleata]
MIMMIIMQYSLGFFGDMSSESPLCLFVGLWLQYPLGLHVVLCVLLYRFMKLHRVLVQRKELDDRWHRRAILGGLLVLLAIYSVVGSLFATGIIERHRVDDFSVIIPSREVACTIGITELTISMGIAGLLLIILLIFLIRLRASSKLFKEYNETCHGVYSQAFSFIVTSALLFTGQTESVFARYVMIFVNIVATDYYVWQVLGSTLHGCLFRREETLRRYHEDFDEHADTLVATPAVVHNDGVNSSSNSHRFQAGLKRPSNAVPGRRYLRDSVSTIDNHPPVMTGSVTFPTNADMAGVRVANRSASVKDEELVQLAL